MKKKWIAVILFCSLCLSLAACAGGEHALNLMAGVTPDGPIKVDQSAPATFAGGQMAFSVELFKKTVAGAEGENILISPLSVSLALSMAANGAKGETRTQMLDVLSGGMEMDAWNQSLYQYASSLTASDSAKVGIANSVWFRDEKITVKPSFLQTAADYYGASAYKAPFDSATVKDINRWVKDNTDGMIDGIVEKIDPDTMMYLINALVFEADWKRVYYKQDVSDGIFTAADGSEQSAEMMYCTLFSYIETDGAVGFVKDYKGGDFRFVALLPDEGTAVEDFAKTLTGEKLSTVLDNVINTKVRTKLPKFSYEYSAEMNGPLSAMGITDAFNGTTADFSELGSVDDDRNLFLSKVIHKTYIEVGEKGTKAAAVTSVQMDAATSMPPQEEPKIVYLDRPFLFMIVDGEYNLPVFMGVVNSVKSE